MDWTNIHAWKSKSLFAHNIQKNRKDVKPYPTKLDNGPLSLAICLGTMVATMFMFFAKVPVATVCLTAYYYIFVCVFTGSLRQWKWTRIYGPCCDPLPVKFIISLILTYSNTFES